MVFSPAAEFLAYSTGYYVDDLGPHVRRWRNESAPFLPFTYANPSDNVTIYAALLFNEHTGSVVELHSAQLTLPDGSSAGGGGDDDGASGGDDDDALATTRALFEASPLPASACSAGFALKVRALPPP